MTPLIFAMPGNEEMTRGLAANLDAELGQSEVRRFPDGESYVRIDSDVRGRDVVVVCTLDRPDEKFLPLAFFAATARELGAKRIGLVAPYLAYMRQDKRFRPGEGVTSAYFANLLGERIDWLVTMDPHLHRHKSLAEIYAIPTAVAHAGSAIGDWIRARVSAPVVVGPDGESEQWVAAVAEQARAPYFVLEKTRLGDRDVKVSTPDTDRWKGRTPVLVDDIVSTARTMIAAAAQFREAGFGDIVAVGVHALFAGGAYDDLKGSGVSRIVTCNTVPHPSNDIDVAGRLAAAVRDVACFSGEKRKSALPGSRSGADQS